MRKIFFKMEKLLFYFYLFSLPWQTRIFLFQRGGSFNEWTSGYLYLTDVLFLFLVIFWFFRIFKEGIKFTDWRLEIILGIFWFFGGVSVFLATDKILSLYGFFKLTQLLLLFFYVRSSFAKFNSIKIFFAFLSGSLFQATVAIAQFFTQKSLGLKYLGEPPLAADIAGVAKINFLGDKVMRAYGTLPHPNVLGIFLFVALVFLVVYIFKNGFRLWQIAPLGVLILGLLVSFSRLAIFVTLVCLATLFLKELLNKKKRRRALGVLFFIIFFVFLSCSLIGQVIGERLSPESVWHGQAKDLRVYYTQIGWEMIKQQPFGVGLNSFTSQFIENFKRLNISLEDWMFQPIHNIYLLIVAEMGFIGLVIFLWFLSEIFRHLWREKMMLGFWLVFCSFLFLGFFDHYFWTLQQGQLLFWGMLGIMAGDKEEK